MNPLMKFLTFHVRWDGRPNAHFNVTTRWATHWHMSKWTYNPTEHAGDQPTDTQHLTIICVQIASENVDAYLEKLKKIMSPVFAKPACDQLQWGEFNELLYGHKHIIANTWSVSHTFVRPGISPSFYGHVDEKMVSAKLSNWNMCNYGILADEMTALKVHMSAHHVRVTLLTQFGLTCYMSSNMFRPCVQQEPHKFTVLLAGSPTRSFGVRCEEAQLLHELLMRYGLTCSMVWDCTTSLSPNCPCTALCEQSMSTVFADVLSCNENLKEAKMTQFYCNMKHIKVQIEGGALRYKPEGMKSMGATLYYSDDMSTLRKVVEEDGRFKSSARCVDSKGWVVDDKCVSEFNQGQELTIMGKTTIYKFPL